VSQHRSAPVRPRYGRLAALGTSLSVTLIAVLGGTGVLPSAAGDGGHRHVTASVRQVAERAGVAHPGATATGRPGADATEAEHDPARDTTLPVGSGTGRRIVFSQGRQRVWLVSRGTHVERTYLVSGSRYDNLDPGTYAVYSRSQQAWGVDDSGTMRYFVRFTQGDNAAIGFHDIPVDDGAPVQTVAQLGTPLSHGCIRQKRADAVALWNFAPVGTTVVVTP
jgi:hypothetical protein